jgi:sulfur-oxidizing protein SoxZ
MSRKTHKIRARMRDDVAEIRVLIQHPMETGRRTDPLSGLPVPRHFIREIHCLHNGEEVLSADWSWGMARNPYLSYRVLDAKRGDKVAIHWTDNQGLSASVETLVE